MRIALGISYDGTAYHGWQRQDNLVTIQECLETALSRVADHPTTIICAGRTDRGVHGLGQVVHFDTEAQRSSTAWVLGTNTHLPSDIRVRWAAEVSNDFHARFSAVARHYRYVIYVHPIRPALLRQQVTTYYQPLDVQRMQTAGNYLLGEHDFSAYRANECQAKTPVRTVTELAINQNSDFITIDIKANAFLHHMVRNIVGVLLEIGSGKRPPEWAKTVLENKQRAQGGVTAPPYGLYFMRVFYPPHFAISNDVEPLFLEK